LRTENDRLKQDLSDTTRQAEQLRCELNQVTSEKRNSDDHSAILSTKARLLKAELQKQAQINGDLTAGLESAQSHIEALESKLEASHAKMKRLKATAASIRVAESRSSALNSDNQKCRLRIQQLEMEREEQTRIIDLLQHKIQKFTSTIESASEIDSLKSNVDQLTSELQGRAREAEALTSQNQELETRLKQTEALVDDLKSRAGDSVRLEVRLQTLQNEHSGLMHEIAELRTRERDSSRAQADLAQISTENRVLRGELEALQKVVARFDEVEAENRSLQERLKQLPSPESYARAQKTFTQLTEKLQRSERENSQLGEIQSELLNVQGRLTKRESELQQLLNEIQERERREQHLGAKYRFYKVKSTDQETQIHVCEAKLHELNQELVRLRERECQKEAALRRKRRTEHHLEGEKSKLLSELEAEREKVLRIETQIQNLHRRV
jgi:chromosome segregation protein